MKYRTRYFFIMVMIVLLVTFSCSKKSQQALLKQFSDEPLDMTVLNSNKSLPKSKILSTGPNGESATSAATLSLSEDEVRQVRAGNYTAVIVMHYAGNDWSTAQEKGLRAAFDELGIKVLSVTDAQFKAEKQVSDIETALVLNPDVMVSIPVDAVSTAPAYKSAADQGVKIVFMDNSASGLVAGQDYVSVVSADNYGNGVAAAEIMAEELGETGNLGVIYYDADFFVTNQRTEAFVNTIQDKYPNMQIVEQSGFNDPNKVSTVADAMLTKHPDLNGIFAVWDLPAESVVASAKSVGRDDLVVTTIDLGNNAARIIAEGGIIKGLGAQLPYNQGVAEATLAAYALLGKDAPPYVAVPSLAVRQSNLKEAYQQVYQKTAPPEVIGTE